MKTNIMSKGAAILLLGMLAACNKSGNTPATATSKAPAQGDKASNAIAYVEIDSLMSQYEFCKEFTEVMQKRSESYKAQINAKGQQLQKAAADFQNKMQQGAYTSQEQAMKVQQGLQRQQESLQQLQEELAEKFDKEQAGYNKALRDSVKSFLNEYNKTHGYAMIISKAGDNVLYADKHLDITDEVISGLNKRYKKSKK